jgi:L,D-transpeptidase ErfK/SrfK
MKRIKVGRIFFKICISVFFSGVAHGEAYDMPPPGDDIVGEVTQVRSQAGDTLLTIANQYGIGMHEMLEANPQLGLDQVGASHPLIGGEMVTVPAEYILPPYRKGIVVNLPEARMYYFSSDGRHVYTYPLGLGRADWRTPLAKGSVTSKEVDPTWNVPPSIHKYVLETTGTNLPPSLPPGPENPLGKYAMRLSITGYLIHGTNQPWTIGKFVSSGCIRMHNEDVEELFQIVKIGTPVRIINYAQKAGWRNGQLYMESQEPMSIRAPASDLNPVSVDAVISAAVGGHGSAVDWQRVHAVMQESLGIPQPIGGISTAVADFNQRY